jgi:predicted metal-binding membrane protein
VIATAKQRSAGEGLGPAVSAVRAEGWLVALLLVLAAIGWWFTVDRMQGMDSGPWSDLGALGWFLGVWVVMMAAMMLPSAAPTLALYARMVRGRRLVAPLAFAAGYLVIWAGVGIVAFGIAEAGGHIGGDVLAWQGAGRWVAGGTLVVAAVYELTPLKGACLGKCRSPLGFLVGAWREGPSGALEMGARHGAWCVGCCWALMAALFALGIMSITWMAFVAALIAAEKLIPWGRAATYGTAAILFGVGLFLLIDPASLPGLTIPAHGSMGHMHMQMQMQMGM